jgi:hypothetical protein
MRYTEAMDGDLAAAEYQCLLQFRTGLGGFCTGARSKRYIASGRFELQDEVPAKRLPVLLAEERFEMVWAVSGGTVR